MDVDSGYGGGSRQRHSVLAQNGRKWGTGSGSVVGEDGRGDSGKNRKWLIAIVVNDSPTASVCSQTAACPVHLYMSTCQAAGAQATRKRRKTKMCGTRCWRHSRCRAQPSDTTEPAGLGGLQGGIVMSRRVGHPVQVHGVVSREATAETPKNTICELETLRELCAT